MARHQHNVIARIKKAFPEGNVVNAGDIISVYSKADGELLCCLKRNVHGDYACDKEYSGAKHCRGEMEAKAIEVKKPA